MEKRPPDREDVYKRQAVYRISNGSVDHRHNEHTEKIKDGSHKDSRLRLQGTGRDARRDRVRRIGPAVYENNAQRQDDRNQKSGVRPKLRNKF